MYKEAVVNAYIALNLAQFTDLKDIVELHKTETLSKYNRWILEILQLPGIYGFCHYPTQRIIFFDSDNCFEDMGYFLDSMDSGEFEASPILRAEFEKSSIFSFYFITFALGDEWKDEEARFRKRSKLEEEWPGLFYE